MHPMAQPLATRMRPQTLDDVLGQGKLLSEGSPLRNLLTNDQSGTSIILWGPPGTGKTTLALLAAQQTGKHYQALSAVNDGVKQLRDVITQAQKHLDETGKGTILFLDEAHRFSKTQQDALLPAVENGWVTLIAATTENPHFALIAPLLSRSVVLNLQSLDDQSLGELLDKAMQSPQGLKGATTLDKTAKEALVQLSGGDARRALTILEASFDPQQKTITYEMVEKAAGLTLGHYDRAGDMHYDIASALIKSIRGSDVDAALHYLARMLAAGEDPRFIARRLVILASEDIGLADPTSLQTAVAAMTAVNQIGLPEAQYNLAQAVVHLSLAPKSNSLATALSSALQDATSGQTAPVPVHLRGKASQRFSSEKGKSYIYPHDMPEGIAEQQYIPNRYKARRYWKPTGRGMEARFQVVWDNIRKLLNKP